MKISIVYDNTAYLKSLQPDWGFSCVLEGENMPKILFDTGANGQILLSNLYKLNIDPKSIDLVFISHAHFDHTGGLASFLQVNDKIKVYLPNSCRGFQYKDIVVPIKKAQKLQENIFSTGELSSIEQSLIINSEKGLILITGCSHPGLANILKAASSFGEVWGVLGGLHGFTQFELLSNLDWVCPTHCTMYKEEIRYRYPDKNIEGGVGKVIRC